MKFWIAGAVATLGLALVMVASNDAGEKAKFTISEVMAKAMKGGLCKKCATGKASDAEKAELVELFTALAANPCPKGDAKSWKAKTSTLVAAAKAVAKGDEGADKKLQKAADCGGCHKAHKG